MNKKIFALAALVIAFTGWEIYNQQKEVTMADLSQTDPEFSLIWENFLNQEVIPHGNLSAKKRFLVLLATHIATQSEKEYRLILNKALKSGVTPVEVRETVYQTIPYVGMAKVYNFFELTNQIFSDNGIQLPLDNQGTTTAENRLNKGIAVQSAIFGSEHIRQMRADAPQELKHVQDYLSANCFGDYYTRTGLDLQTRELLTFVALVAMGGADPQVKAHVQGNLNIGNDKQLLLDTVTQMLPYIGYPRSLNGITAINEIAKD